MEVKIINITLKPKGKKPEQKIRLEERVREGSLVGPQPGCRQSPPESHADAGRPRRV